MPRSQIHPKHTRTVDYQTLLNAGRHHCSSYGLESKRSHANPKLLCGQYSTHSLREGGLQVKCADLIDLDEVMIRASVPPGLHLVVLLEGQAEARYGRESIRLGRTDRHTPEALLFNLAESENFERQSRPGSYERKVSLSMQQSWLEASGLPASALQALHGPHLKQLHWSPSLRLRALAAEMLDEAELQPELLRPLYLETRALEILLEALAQARQFSGQSRPTRGRRIEQLRDWLDSGEADRLSLEEIARHAGLNAHSLQQQFRTAHGVTIFEYLRRRKLEQARQALEREELSISQAAWEAGYSSAANFSTAFRKTFGISPGKLLRGGA